MQLRCVLSQAILDTKKLTDVPNPSPELTLKVAHALGQLAGPYTKILEGAELADISERLTILEAQETVEDFSNGHYPPRRR
jgi:hypothetical protein